MGLSSSGQGQDILAIIKEVQHLGRNDPGSQVVSDDEPILEMLLTSNIALEGLMPWSSNYTFLVSLPQPHNELALLGIYKPCRGERPLWDFPDGSLCRREFTSYLVSQVLGWPRIPATVLRNGPHGRGSLQLFIETEYEAHYFNMRHIPTFSEEFRRIALFDFIVNNADRKGGHCLKGKEGQLWAIDHGLTFHTDFKLRTVIWEFCDEVIPDLLLEDLRRLQSVLDSTEFCQILALFITPAEVQAFRKRLDRMVSRGYFPELHPGRNVPFPPI